MPDDSAWDLPGRGSAYDLAMRIPRWAPILVLGFSLLAVSTAETADPLKDIKSKDYETRLKAVKAIRKNGGEGAEKALVTALKDSDWEVVEHAVLGLGEHGGEKALKALVDVAAAGPVRRVRLAAAASLAKLDVEESAKRLTKRLRRDEAVNAAEALTILARRTTDPVGKELLKGVGRCFKSKDASVRAAAAGALFAFPAEERVERFEKLLDDGALTVVAAALDQMRARPALDYLSTMTARLAYPNVNDVVARRVIAAAEAVFEVLDAKQTAAAVRVLDKLIGKAARDPALGARVARLVGNLASRPPVPEEAPEKKDDAKKDDAKKEEGERDPAVKDDKAEAPKPTLAPSIALGLLEQILKHDGEAARAEAVRALRRIGTKEAIDRAEEMLKDDDPRVRVQALEALAEGRGLADDGALDLVTDRLLKDPEASVREAAALLLGRSGPEGAPFSAPVPALTVALKDKVWSVAVVAAVSLGKTRSEKAAEPLASLLNRKKHKDWRIRGAGVIGLGKLQQKNAVTPLIGALKDRDTWVRRNAFEFLRRMTKRSIGDDFDEWTAWWDFNKSGYEFIDRERIARELKKGGYAVDPVDVYEKGKAALDVVVLQSRGDHIEQLLEELGVEYRLTRAAQVEKADIHSFAVFIANCTGEIQKNDIERLQWFVRVGGYLFSSCWALHHTVEKVYPGMIRKLETRSQVVDNVVSTPCPCDSHYLENVFRPWSQAKYVLEGAHLIEVMQPERVEVLIDSPQAAARWGGGNMAAWFRAGHGVILDSANHFDLQGLQRVTGLKTAEDRMAHAMDHMGLDYPELRSFAASRVWARQAQAMKLVRDHSAFRFITNFVRLKRKTDP